MKKLLVILLIVVGLGLWLWGVNDAYVGIYNTNNNYLALASKNFLRFGIFTLKFAPTYFAGGELPEQVEYYLHHPVLMFYFALMPFKLFGFANWVARAATGMFLLGAMGMIYLLGREVWNKKVSLWAVILAIWFPMTSFFWKYIFFEQATLFFNLIIIYLVVKYIKNWNISNVKEISSRQLARINGKTYLIYIGMFTFLSTATDWYGGYLLFSFLFFLISPYRRAMIRILAVYLSIMILTILGFIVYVYIIEGTLANVVAAIFGRAVDAELFDLSFWPARIFVISIVRIVLYFTPLGVIGGIWVLWRKLWVRKWQLGEWVLVGFLILGILNNIFLPTASWGHSYFLFYLIPFFAYAGALIVERMQKGTLALLLVSLIISAIGVQYFKQIQVKKQLWKYEIAKEVNKVLNPYEVIGTTNFPGDVLENYFLHQSRAIAFDKLPDWVSGLIYPEVNKLIFTCAGECTEGELVIMRNIGREARVEEYRVRNNSGWLVEKSEGVKSDAGQMVDTQKMIRETVNRSQTSKWLILYRWIRDIIGATQI